MTIDLYSVVMKLTGPVEAVGDTHADLKRFENLKALTELVDLLLGDIHAASQTADRKEASMQAIGLHARNFLREVKER